MANKLTPRMEAVLATMRVHRDAEAGVWLTAEAIGWHMNRMGKLPEVNRHGRGAVKGSWSGHIAPGLQLASTMQALARRGLVEERGDPRSDRYRSQYRLSH